MPEEVISAMQELPAVMERVADERSVTCATVEAVHPFIHYTAFCDRSLCRTLGHLLQLN